MEQITFLYPKIDGATFDMDYFLNKHIPFAVQSTGAIKSWTVTEYTSGTDGREPPYMVQAIATLSSIEAYYAGVEKGNGAVIDDIPNYTNVTPMVLHGRRVADS
jgi:uncharacterized protein (TIGR02118 family)